MENYYNFCKDKIIEILKQKLSKERLYHTMCVADEAKKLAKHYCYDEEKAYVCGLLHDILKEDNKNELIDIIKSCVEIKDEILMHSPKVWHSIAGAIYIKEKLCINDEDIINAVYYHTTAKADMNLLEKIIFIADIVSIDRSYKGVNELRDLAYSDIDKAIFEALKYTLADLAKKGASICSDTFSAYNQYAILFKED